MSYKFYIDKEKYRVKPQETYIRLNGWCFDTKNQPFELVATINHCKVKTIQDSIVRKDVRKKYGSKYQVPVRCGFYIKAYIPPHILDPEEFTLYAKSAEGLKKIVSYSHRTLQKMKEDSTISYCLDQVFLDEKKIRITGWGTTIFGMETLKFAIRHEDGSSVEDVRLSRNKREDVLEAGLVKKEELNCGFTIEFSFEETEKYELLIYDKRRCKHIKLIPGQIRRHNSIAAKTGFARQFVKCINMKNIGKGIEHIHKYGVKGLGEYIVSRVNSLGKPYKEWFEEQKPDKEELMRQRKTVFEYEPKISIVVPTYKTPIHFLREMIDSVREQSYRNWELCIADGSEGDLAVEKELKRYAELDARIVYRILDKNEGISGNTNQALELATGEYVGLFDHDDILAPNALYEVVKALQEKEYDILYTDEDKISGDKKEHNDPNFKPDFSMDLFCSHNYITHFFVVKMSIIKKIGGFRAEYDGSQDYDLMFRCIEESEHIKHIPKILYHWRIHMNSVAGDPTSKMYAYEAGKKAIEDHFKRVGIEASVEHTGLWGMYHVIYKTPGNPLVSIMIPNKDHIKDLNQCIQSIYKKSSYREFEIIIIENNSEKEETFDYYEKIQNKYSNLKVVTWKGKFNYSAINNFGVQSAKGEYLLFLNNDTEMINETALEELVGVCMRNEVGAVGAKLLYEDDTVQHAGVVIGFGGYAGHVHVGIGREDYGYMVRARINCNYSAVTAACMLTKRSVFDQVGGFDEQFVVACNDVDYCLKLREIDKLIVYNAFSEWHHYESKSRGYEDTPEKMMRFENEVKKFRKKWPDILENGDPYYNPNFPVTQAPFTLG